MRKRKVSRVRGVLAVFRYAAKAPRIFVGLALRDEQAIHQCQVVFYWASK